MTNKIKQAFILAAGLGTRMQPLTDKLPKPLIKVAGKSMIVRTIDQLADNGIERIVINAWYLADQLIEHVTAYTNELNTTLARPIEVIFSPEAELLETGGGILNGLKHLDANEPFFIVNGDSVFLAQENVFAFMNRQWSAFTMDALFLVCSHDAATGYDGRGDFDLAPDGRLVLNENSATDKTKIRPFIYTGIHIASPKLFDNQLVQKIGLMNIYKPFITNHKLGRMYGVQLQGRWLHVGTPEALAEATRIIGEDRLFMIREER